MDESDKNIEENANDLQQWAQSLVAAIGSAEAKGLYDDFVRIAADKRVTKSGREIARRRADALRKELSRNP